jgi:hypothetical protein
MFLPLVAIAFTFLGVWIFAAAIKSWIRSTGKPKIAIASPKSGISLISLLMFLFAPASVTDFLHPMKFEVESERGED